MSEITYERRVSVLERKYQDRIARKATDEVERLRRSDDLETVQLEATERVSQWLLDDLRWEDVEAADISDIAYEAVAVAIRQGY